MERSDGEGLNCGFNPFVPLSTIQLVGLLQTLRVHEKVSFAEMSGFKKRPHDHNGKGAEKQGKFAKNGHGSGDNKSEGSPADSFLRYLVKARTIISSLDIKACLRDIPMILSVLVDKTNQLLRVVKDADQLSDAINELRAFNARETVSRFNLARLTILLDNCYYTLYYCVDVNARAMNSNSSAIYSPKEYFTSKILTPELTSLQNHTLHEYLDRSVSAKGREQLNAVWGSLLTGTNTSTSNTATSTAKNPLLDVHFARWRESVCLLSLLGAIPDTSETSKLTSSCRPQVIERGETPTMKGTDPIMPAALRQWNDGCRVWPCHLYSFATPTVAALDKLASLAPLVEIGAGTGYWAHLLRTHATFESIVAYDKDPPSALGRVLKPNDYHGKSKAWTAVRKGGPEVAAQHTTSALFLCYPPPDNAMGLLALRAYKGDTVAYVGEWQGDTGTKGFEKLLSAEFSCEERLTLPNWGDTCYTLTVWRRRGSGGRAGSGKGTKGGKDGKSGDGKKDKASAGGSAVPEHLLPHTTHPFLCSHCGRGRTDATTSTNSPGSDGSVRQLFRCRLTYNVYFCSSECAVQGRATHLDELAVKCLLQGVDQGVQGGASKEVEEVDAAVERVVATQPLLELTASNFVKVSAPCRS